MSSFEVITLSADALAPLGARASAGTMMTKFGYCMFIYMEPALQWLSGAALWSVFSSTFHHNWNESYVLMRYSALGRFRLNFAERTYSLSFADMMWHCTPEKFRLNFACVICSLNFANMIWHCAQKSFRLHFVFMIYNLNITDRMWNYSIYIYI